MLAPRAVHNYRATTREAPLGDSGQSYKPATLARRESIKSRKGMRESLQALTERH